MSTETNRPELLKINTIHTFFKAEFKPNYVFKGEQHNYMEFVFAIRGKVGISSNSKDYILNEGQCFAHRANEFHKIWTVSAEPPCVIIVSLTAENFPEFDHPLFDMSMESFEEIQAIYDISEECFVSGTINAELKIEETYHLKELWLRLELLMYNVFSGNKEHSYESKYRPKGESLYRAAIDFMENNLTSDLSVGDIANEFSISAVYLKKLFVKYAGCGVKKYYNNLRIKLACRYLDMGKTVKETSEYLGFSDQNYFSTFFKREFGVSPANYKLNNQLTF